MPYVYKHINNFILVNNILTHNQSGFTCGDSAIYQLLYITNEFGRALDAGKEIRVVPVKLVRPLIEFGTRVY